MSFTEIVKHPALIALLLLMSLPVATPARAEGTSCAATYEKAADDYWHIVAHMTRFKAIFDNYDTLCQKYYPDDIKKLQPDADHLRAQVRQDMKDAPRVITAIFDNTLPGKVSKACASDTKSRDAARKAFIANMQSRSKSMEARMKKSAATLRDPKSDLKLCHDVGALTPVVKAKLGPDFAMPLLTMSEINNAYMVRDNGTIKQAFAKYRETLEKLNASR